MSTRESLISKEKYYEERMQYWEKCDAWIEEINRYFEEQTMDNIKNFLSLMKREDVCKYGVNTRAELAYANLLQVITVGEINVYGQAKLLSMGNSLEQLAKVIKEIEFCMWELEFVGDAESENRMKECILMCQVTPITLRWLLQVAAVEKQKVCLQLAYLFLTVDKIQEAILLLQYGVDDYPHDKELLRMLIELCKSLGLESVAEKYCMRLENENAEK